MKKIATIFISTLISLQAYASPTVISQVMDKEFGVMPADKSVYCSRYDKDQDGVKETTTVSIDLGKTIHDGATYLQANYISNNFNDPTGELCKKVERIKSDSFTSFGATYGKATSVLMLDRAVIVEQLSITIGRKGKGLGADGVIVEVDSEITLTKTISKDLTL